MKTQTRLAISLSHDPMDTEYVYLVDAQKEIQKQEMLTWEQQLKVADLKAMVEAANKILNEYPLPFGLVDDWKKVQSWLDRLRSALLIPRKEECQVGGVPQNVPSCKELKPEVFRDCQGYTSKIVKKENTTP